MTIEEAPLLMSVAVASKLSGVSRTELRRWIDAGRLRAVKVGSKWRVRKEELLAALDALPTV